MTKIEKGDGLYLFNVIDWSSGITTYTIEKDWHQIKAISLLSEEEGEELREKIRKSFVEGFGPAEVEIQIDLALDKEGVRFGMIVGLGEPRS